jgi:hypothetical protein
LQQEQATSSGKSVCVLRNEINQLMVFQGIESMVIFMIAACTTTIKAEKINSQFSFGNLNCMVQEIDSLELTY